MAEVDVMLRVWWESISARGVERKQEGKRMEEKLSRGTEDQINVGDVTSCITHRYLRMHMEEERKNER